MPPGEAVTHLVGLQAQEPPDPYLALWSRLEGFRPDGVGGMLERRELVRIIVMRGTIHLVTADDCRFLRPLTQPVLDAQMPRHTEFRTALAAMDVDAVAAAGREILEEAPRSGRELRAALLERFPDGHGPAMAFACRCRLPLVQVPPRGVWGRTSQAVVTTAESWLGAPLHETPSIDEMVLRYLGAFGPATVADVAAWSRLTGFREVLDRLRPRLVTVRDERGRELFDLPDARPDPETPAPPRFLPRYDNVLLSHADRTRFVRLERRARASIAGPVRGSLLVDGALQGTWSVEGDASAGAVTLVVRHLDRLGAGDRAEVADEGMALLGLTHPGSGPREIRLVHRP